MIYTLHMKMVRTKYYRCSAKNCDTVCEAVRKTPDSLLPQFFKFPKNPERCRTWVKNCGNLELLKIEAARLCRIRYICEAHFTVDQFWNNRRNSLMRNAVPTLFTAPPLTEEEMSGFQMSKDAGIIYEFSTPEFCQETFSDTSSPITIFPSIENIFSDETPYQSDTTACNMSTEASQCGSSLIHNSASERSKHRLHRKALSTVSPKVTIPSKTNKLKKPVQFRQQCKQVTKKIEDLRRRSQTYKIQNCMKLVEMSEKILNSPAGKQILQGKLCKFRRLPKRRRWTLSEKCFALTVYKGNPRTYSFLARYITLPSESTLKRIYHRNPLKPGLGAAYLQHLKGIIQNLPAKDRLCVLMFGEISLCSGLYYNSGSSVVEGFEDFGSFGRTNLSANNALVFVVQGLNRCWKQPLSYYFVRGTAPVRMLVKLITENIRSLTSIGLEVLATICDQGPSNRSAVRILRNGCPEGQYEPVFEIDGRKIVHIFDVPSILRNIRNQFFTSDIQYDVSSVAKWDHIVQFYELDKSLCNMAQLTEAHLNPTGKEKMQVKLAAEVFSSNVSSIIKTIAVISEGEKLGDCVVTANFLADVDLFFDITNGSAGLEDKIKPTRCNVRAESPHHNLWKDMKTKLDEWIFIRKCDGSKHVPPCVKAWIDDILGMQRLWQTVMKHGLKHLNLRHLNQDPIVNLFTIIQFICGRNRHPTCPQFTAAMVTAIVHQMSLAKIKNENNEDEEGSSLLLIGLRRLIKMCKNNISQGERKLAVTSVPHILRGSLLTLPTKLSKVERWDPTYVCGCLVQNVLKKRSCKVCSSNLTDETTSLDHTYSEGETHLQYASPQLLNTFLTSRKKFNNKCLSLLHQKNVLKCAEELIAKSDDFDWLMCPNHKDIVQKALKTAIASFFIRTTCKRLNKYNQITYMNRKKKHPKKYGSFTVTAPQEAKNSKPILEDSTIKIKPTSVRRKRKIIEIIVSVHTQ